MKTRTKEVRISVNTRPVTNLSTGIILSKGTYATMKLSHEDIFKCICGKAVVEEKLPDGSFMVLDLFNYNKPNYKVNECDESISEQNDPPQIPLVSHKNVDTIPEGTAETEYNPNLVKPKVSPLNQKELVNPSASIAGSADLETTNTEETLAGKEDGKLTEAVEQEVANSPMQNNTQYGKSHKNNNKGNQKGNK